MTMTLQNDDNIQDVQNALNVQDTTQDTAEHPHPTDNTVKAVNSTTEASETLKNAETAESTGNDTDDGRTDRKNAKTTQIPKKTVNPGDRVKTTKTLEDARNTKNNPNASNEPYEYTRKQLRFIDEYIIDFNATRAYKSAGYKDSESSRQSAYNLLSKAYMQIAIEQKMAEIAVNVKVTPEDVIRMLKNEAMGLTKVDGSSSSQSARVAAISLLGKVHGMFIDNTNVNVTDLDSRMRAANERIEKQKDEKAAAQQAAAAAVKEAVDLVSDDK